MPIPLLILSDSPSSFSGLGRITRELSQRIASNLGDKFRLATLGYGGVGSAKFPWQQYNICGDLPSRRWFVPELYTAWNDFSGGERGVVLTIWDSTRLDWLAYPNNCPDKAMRAWLIEKPFQLWGYWPVDAEGVGGGLPHGYSRIMQRYDRNLAYSDWAKRLMEHDGILADALPHGIDTSVWVQRPKRTGRKKLRATGLPVDDDSFVVGVVATNQTRKDWGLAFATCAELRKRGKDVVMWCHTDTWLREWDLVALAQDFGMTGKVCITTPPMSDEEMTFFYSACDVTLGIGLGEGFGYPIFESLACGTPCIHGAYGGAYEHLSEWMCPRPDSSRYEGQFSCKRPIYDPKHIADICNGAIRKVECNLPVELDWNTLWSRWSDWLLKGVNLGTNSLCSEEGIASPSRS
jgi:glycosyltransferase involved in cell wall biosynthesis